MKSCLVLPKPLSFPPIFCLISTHPRFILHAFLLVMMLFSISILSSQSSTPQRIIKVGIDDNYSPFEFLDKTGKAGGFNVDLIKEIARINNWQVQFVGNQWSQIREDFDQGKLDILAGLVKTDSRVLLSRFSIPHTYIHYNLFFRKGELEIRNWEDLNGKEVLVQKGDVINEILDQKDLNCRIVHVPDYPQALKELSEGRSEITILPWLLGNNYIKEHNIINLQYSKFFNYAYPYCIAVHPQNGDLLPILNANLATLSDNNYISTLRAKWFMTEQNHLPKLPFSRVQVYLGLVFLGLVYMIMLLLLFHYRKMARTKTIGLKLAIQKKNSTIQELMAIHRLFSEGPIIVLKWSDSEHEMFSFVSENINRYNYQASDLLSGKLHFRNIIHPDDLDSVLKDRYQHLVLKEYSYEQMYRIVCPSAELQASVTASEEALLKQLNPYLAKANSLDIRWILDFTFCVLDPVTKQRFFQGYLVDVTEQQIKNAEVNKNRLIAEDALAAKDLFIKGITEEIKIPLFKLHTKLGSLKLINNALLDEEGIMKIETSVQRLENVISDLQEEMNQLDKEMAHQNNDS